MEVDKVPKKQVFFRGSSNRRFGIDRVYKVYYVLFSNQLVYFTSQGAVKSSGNSFITGAAGMNEISICSVLPS